MRVLVTGGAGFIGSYVTKGLLDLGYEVVVLDNFSSGAKKNLPTSNLFKVIDADICDRKKLQDLYSERFDGIIHLAAQVSVPESVKNPMIDSQINITGTLNMLDLAKNTGVQSFVFASTAAVYGNQVSVPILENCQLSPETPYGISKLASEYYIQSICKQLNINYCILRYANVYGPKQSDKGEGGVIKIFSEQLLNNRKSTIYGNGLQTRDFIFVEDVANATIKALNGKNIILNVSTNKEVTINDIYDFIKKECQSSLDPIYTNEREGDIFRSCLSNDLIKKELSWAPSFEMEQGVKRTIQELTVQKNE
ncbi:hypothetical protein CIB95_08470 [Lottiidibacillus patelloidae]|uniref:NAD-dependent epimerase/dehydratase domain-containing protein n=1 Tax=Lottiidibacillus patelloidae TaxID=2670334 RepID=A0A263BV87_9BACI|nr:NAD-dependent epimerase/dehydratase family protein [Lottiidibacillus patelloidae]OZM57478.1 hypothetical protein CIB95_08470 [Lottiidibacillus patelloidae]